MSTQKELDVKKMEATDVKSNPNDVLGLQYNKYKNSLYASSLSKPSEYFKLRGDLEDTLKTELVSDMFTTIYELLRYGTIKVLMIMVVSVFQAIHLPTSTLYR